MKFLKILILTLFAGHFMSMAYCQNEGNYVNFDLDIIDIQFVYSKSDSYFNFRHSCKNDVKQIPFSISSKCNDCFITNFFTSDSSFSLKTTDNGNALKFTDTLYLISGEKLSLILEYNFRIGNSFKSDNFGFTTNVNGGKSLKFFISKHSISTTFPKLESQDELVISRFSNCQDSLILEIKSDGSSNDVFLSQNENFIDSTWNSWNNSEFNNAKMIKTLQSWINGSEPNIIFGKIFYAGDRCRINLSSLQEGEYFLQGTSCYTTFKTKLIIKK